jgi:hypothetical protein
VLRCEHQSLAVSKVRDMLAYFGSDSRINRRRRKFFVPAFDLLLDRCSGFCQRLGFLQGGQGGCCGLLFRFPLSIDRKSFV